MIVFTLFPISLLVLAFMVYNMIGWPRIPPRRARSETPDSVSVLIPARNEETSIAATLEKALAQGEEVREILVYNDHSTDRTAEVVRSWSAQDPRIRLLDPQPLPDGWCGKPFACSRLGAAAQSDWLLFIDADTLLENDAVARMVAEARRRALTFLSCWPGLVLRGFGEKVFMPLLNFVVFTLFPAPLSTSRPLSALGLAHGACILLRREEYRRTGGHALVKNELFEDTALARAWRKVGLRSLCLDGQEIVRVRMYDSTAAIWAGFQKNFFPAFRHETSFFLFWAFHFVFFLLPFILAATGAAAGVFDGTVWGTVGAVLATRAVQARRFAYPFWSVFLHPLAEGALLALALSSWIQCRFGAGVEWKGRTYRKRER